MLNFLRPWLETLNQAERDLRRQGYVVIYGGMTSIIVPIGSTEQAPRPRRKRLWLWGATPAAFELRSDPLTSLAMRAIPLHRQQSRA